MKKSDIEKVRKVNRLSNDLDMLYRRAARKLNVSDCVLRIMYVIYERGDGCLLYDICNESGISKQTINSAIRKLENENILYLEQDKGKTKRICLTEKGKEYINETAVRLYEAECSVFGNWTEDEMNTYLRLMKKYNDSFGEEIKKMNGGAL